VDAEEVGAASHDCGDPRRDLGAINQALLASAKQERLESGATVRLDSTVTEALMHEPSDSTLLSDAVRVISRLLHRAEALPGGPSIRWRDRRRLAKKRARAFEYSRGPDKKRRSIAT
jgi:IS5 family transposase